MASNWGMLAIFYLCRFYPCFAFSAGEFNDDTN
jgi:hypothetical protein